MQANVSDLLSWVSSGVLQMPEHLVLFAVGVLLLALGFSVPIRRTRAGRVANRPTGVGASAPQTNAVLVTQQTR